MIEKIFRLKENHTSLKQEMVAGITTFAAMAYILAVNPVILVNTGMDKGALITATALASAISTILMALSTNYPIALAPGMGLNAFFTYSICIGMGIPWQAALGLVFYGGILLLLLTITGLRRKIVEAIPFHLKIAITCGIGLFIAFIGLKNGGIIVSNPVTYVSLGHLSSPSAWLVLFGIILTSVLIWFKIRGAILLSILILSGLGLFLSDPVSHQTITAWPTYFISFPASLKPSFLALDLGYLWTHFKTAFPIVLALLFVDLFDNLGTLIGVCNRAGFLDRDGNLPKIDRALRADAGAAMIGAVLGTSTTTSYIESAAGIEEGGRTGLTSITVAICFLLSLFLTPLILTIPTVATAPALIIIGVFMMQGVVDLDLADFSKALPAVLLILMMPLSFSISDGIAIGFIVYVFFMLGTGRFKEITPLSYLLGSLFLLHFLTK